MGMAMDFPQKLRRNLTLQPPAFGGKCTMGVALSCALHCQCPNAVKRNGSKGVGRDIMYRMSLDDSPLDSTFSSTRNRMRRATHG